MKKIIVPRSLECFSKVVYAVVLMAVGIAIGAMLAACTPQAKAEVVYDNALKTENDRLMCIIYAYNSVIHRIWIDKPNYVEDVLCESDEWITLEDMVEGDFQHAFDFVNEEDSLSYHYNWVHGDSTIRIVKHVVIPEPTQHKLYEVFGNGD